MLDGLFQKCIYATLLNCNKRLKKRVSTKTPLEYETDLVGELGNKEHINLSALGMKRSLLDASAIAHCQDWKD